MELKELEGSSRRESESAQLRALCAEMVKLHAERGTVLTIHMEELGRILEAPKVATDTPELRELIGDVYRAGSSNESIEKSENALIRHIVKSAG